MNLEATLTLWFGGPGSGCNPAVGHCGRKSSSMSEQRILQMWKPSKSVHEIEAIETKTHNKLNAAAIVAFAVNKGLKEKGKVDPKLVEALRDVYKETQDYYRSKGIKELKLYRGSMDVQKSRQPLESWSTDKSIARAHTSTSDGELQQATIPVSAILLSYQSVSAWPIPEHRFEKEHVVLGGAVAGLSVKDITKDQSSVVPKLHDALTDSGWKVERENSDEVTYKRSSDLGRVYVDKHEGSWMYTKGKGDLIDGRNVNSLKRSGLV